MSGMEITLRDVYEQQLRTAEQVAQMRGDLSTLTARVDERLASGARKMDDHEARLRALEDAVPSALESRISALEQFRWKSAGAAALLGVLGGSGASVLIEWALSR